MQPTENTIDYPQAVLEQMLTAVLVLDQQLNICYLNAACEALLAKSKQKIQRTGIKALFAHSYLSEQTLLQLFNSGQDLTENDVTITLPDGHVISVEINASTLTINAKEFILLELRQIDKQKQLNNEVFQQQQWQNARDLIRGLAHEIKNPLGGLRGAAQLLALELNQEQQEYTQLIIAQADRLTKLVDRLLGPNQLPQLKTQNIHSVIEQVIWLLDNDNPKHIQLIRDYDPSLPELAFDQDKLQQVVLNIAQNAMQVLPQQGTIRFKTRIASNQIINGQVIKQSIALSIIDNGPGIPVNIQDTLFYPMITGRENGTGLGLSIAQTLVQQHHGKISCVSTPGLTNFTILLPLNKDTLDAS